MARRGGCGCLLISLGMTVAGCRGGLQGLYTLASAREQVVMTCADYLRDRPSDLWLKLSKCDADYEGAVYTDRGGRIDELWVPLRPAGTPPGQPAALLLATEDPEWTEFMDRAANALQHDPTNLGHVGEAFAEYRTVDVDGMVLYGVDLSSKERDRLAKVSGGLTPDFVVLADGAAPDWSSAAGWLTLGLVGSLALLFVLSGFAPATREEPVGG